MKKILVFGISVLLVISLGTADYFSGFELSFSIFYLIPVSVSIVFTDLKYGLIISLLSAVTWCLADVNSGHSYSNFLIPVWNSLMRLGYFIIHTVLLSKFIDLYKKVKNDSLTDQLTDAFNSRRFHDLFGHELKKAERTGEAMTLIYFDLDNFKSVNDKFGHLSGDFLLKMFASTVQGNIRSADVFARLGGDEFALLLPETDYAESGLLIRRVKESVEEEFNSREWPVTLSIGSVTFRTFDVPMNEMLKKADSLMYEVKGKGKNDISHIVWE